MRELHTDIEIKATAERVWQILTDFASYLQWNPFIRRVEGRLALGQQLKVRIQPPGTGGMTFSPVVLKAEPCKELRWRGRLFLPGIFDGEHVLRIDSIGDQRVRFIQREEFSGLLVPLLWHSLDTTTRRGFHEMNAALKVRAESTQA